MCFLCREQITLGCRVEVVKPPKTSSCSQRMSESSRRRQRTRSFSSRSRSRSSGSSRYSGRYSRSPSLSSCRWVNDLKHNFIHVALFSASLKSTYISCNTKFSTVIHGSWMMNPNPLVGFLLHQSGSC